MRQGSEVGSQGSRRHRTSRHQTWSQHFPFRRWLVLFLQFSVLGTQYSVALGDDPSSTELVSLAAKCDELGLKEQAEITRGWVIQRDPKRQYLFLPAASDSTALKSGAEEAARQWH